MWLAGSAPTRPALKIEADKLEELHSRVQNLGFVVRLNKVSEAFRYLLRVKELVDYAENRLTGAIPRSPRSPRRTL